MKTKNINLAQISANISSKELVINENNFIIDSLMVYSAKEIITDLPSNASNGDVYIISANSHITEKINHIAIYHGNLGFKFISPQHGMVCVIGNLKKIVIFSANNWTELGDFIGNNNISKSAISGSYNDLNDKPKIFSGNYEDLSNKPTIPTVPTNISAFNNDVNYSPSCTGDFKFSAQTTNHGKWLLCNGQGVSRTTYPSLFEIFGTSFGAGDGTTTFNLPDFRGRIFGAIGQGKGLTNREIGNSVGEERHAMTAAELVSHSHQQSIGYSSGSGYYGSTSPGVGSVFYNQADGFTSKSEKTSTAGSSAPFNVMQPTIFAGNVFVYRE